MVNKGLKDLLIGLGLYNTDTVFFFKKDEGKIFKFPSRETEKKFNIIKPTAFYVFNDQPYILFFDLTANNDPTREQEIHKQVWSFDQSPLVFIVKDGDIKIFNAFSYEKKVNRLQEIKLNVSENRDEIFSFWNLQSGATWIWLQENHYKNTIQNKRVNQKLFENIKLVRETLTNKSNEGYLSEDDSNILILRLIFIRYLIDRNVKLDTEYINGSEIIERKKSFSELIEKPRKLNEFFSKLNDKFNGVLFKDIKIQLSKIQATALAQVFNGEKPESGSLFDGTDFYFEVFDFSIIPVEVISGIYESLIDENTRKLHSAVYTPSFLVEYILSNTIDNFFKERKNKTLTDCRIFDPSVGSGIFLVQAFRRMVDREISLGNDAKISKVRLREIAQNNLFGIDINLQALKVTCFSIYIAILDYQDPKTILDNFHFPRLIDENLFCANFFDTTHTYNKVIHSLEPNFILGNPPWKSTKEDTHTNWLKTTNQVTGRYEIAQSFLLRSKDFMGPQTISALIVTSTIFYNVSQTTKQFKRDFLTTFCLNSFFDLSPVRRLIFEEKNSPCAIVFYHLSIGEQYLKNIIKHQSIKSNTFLKYYKTLVIEKFDQKNIQQKYFIENDWMFKVALYGNTLDFILLKKLENNSIKISDLIDEKTIFKGAGIERGKEGKYYPGLENLPIIENNAVKPYFSSAKKLKTLKKEETNLSRGRKVEIFKGYKILFKEQNQDESDPLISIMESTCVFRKGIFSIASVTDPAKLKIIYGYLLSDLYTYFLFIRSCSWGVSTRPQTRLDEEYLAFPFIEAENKINVKLTKLVDEFLAPFKEFYSRFTLGDPSVDKSILVNINLIIENLYTIKNYEKDLIAYTLDISRYQFQENKQDRIIRKIHNDHNVLKSYVEIFRSEFEKIYENEYIHVDVYPLFHFIAINFSFEKQKPNHEINIISTDENTDKNLVFKALSNSISISQVTKDLYIQKDIKGFEENSFYIIKPNEYKCWHKAMAWYDVSEIKEAIQSEELERLNKHD